MVERKVVLFEHGGPENTAETLEAVRERVVELGIRDVVLATSTGETAVRALEALRDTGARIVAVTLSAGLWGSYVGPEPEKVAAAEAGGVRFLTATHTLMGNVEAAVRGKFGGVPPVELIAHTYYTFSQGMKVAVEVALMAADGGLIPVEADVIALAGSGHGADTAIVLKPACSNDFFDLKVREVIAMPR